MARQVLIIHGWSDHSSSFVPLADFLTKNGFEARILWLADYISEDADVRVEDVARRMNTVIGDMIRSETLDKSFDVIVHSTGGLVARAWLTGWYSSDPRACPMKRLIMLAPANYGSKLAATGKSFLGRILKGYDNWFHTGQSMLNDLELSSSLQWELVQRDVLQAPGGDATRYYGANLVWPFVIVGTHPYASLLRQIVNENGADGTVRVCAANLNARGVTIDFRDPNPVITPWQTRLECDVPLAVLPTRTHGSIVDPDRVSNAEDISETPDEKAQLGRLILQALSCKDFGEYQNIQKEWDALTEVTASRYKNPQEKQPDFYHQYMQGDFSVVDDQGLWVNDYILEFFSGTDPTYDKANVYMHGKVIEDVVKNSQNAALRTVYFDRTDLVDGYYAQLPPGAVPTLFLSISAAAPGKNISYFRDITQGAPGQVPLHLEDDAAKRWLRRNTTHFIRLIIPRVSSNPDVFQLRDFPTLTQKPELDA